jgi:hypothetical protein
MILLHLRESNFLAWMNFRIFTCQRFTDWYEYTCGFISIDVVVVGWHEIGKVGAGFAKLYKQAIYNEAFLHVQQGFNKLFMFPALNVCCWIVDCIFL